MKLDNISDKGLGHHQCRVWVFKRHKMGIFAQLIHNYHYNGVAEPPKKNPWTHQSIFDQEQLMVEKDQLDLSNPSCCFGRHYNYVGTP